MSTFISALFDGFAGAEEGVRTLIEAGFPRDAISMLGSEAAISQEMEATKSRRPQIAGAGALAGAGAVIATLPLVAIPGTGLIGVGLLLTAIGAGGGAVLGSFATTILSAATELQESGQKDRAIAHGKIIVGVEASGDQIDLAKQTLLLAGGQSATGEPGTLSSDQLLMRPVE